MTDALSTTEIPNLKEQLKTLESLQELDLKIDRIQRDKNALPANLKQKDTSLAALKKQSDTKTTAISEIEKVQRQTKAAMEMNDDRLKRSTSRLEQVQNTQEYQAVTKEIEQLKKFLTQLEEQNQKSQTEIDKIQKEVAALTEQMATLQGERDTEAEQVGAQGGKLDEQLSLLSKDRSEFTAKVDRRILSIYDRVRVARGGFGFVPIANGRCKGCNMMVPPQLHNEVQRGTKLHACPSCHRLLFVPGAPGQANGLAGSSASSTSTHAAS